jgi:hypothetical protein
VTNTNVQSSGDNAIIVTAGEIGRTSINGIVQQLRSVEDRLELGDDDRAELKAERATLEAQMSSPTPKREIVMGTLRSIWRIVEGAAAGTAAVPLLGAIRKMLGRRGWATLAVERVPEWLQRSGGVVRELACEGPWPSSYLRCGAARHARARARPSVAAHPAEL